MPAMVGARLWELFRRHRAGRALLLMIDVLDQHHAPIAASAIAFDAFLSLVPLAAFAGMVMHRLHESDMILRPLLRASPAPVAELVERAASRLSDDNAAVIAPVSIVAFIWTTSSGLSTAMSVFEKMFNSPERPWWWRRGVAMVSILASVAIVAAVTGITVGIGMISVQAGAIVAVIVPTATLVGMLSAFFRISVRRGPRSSPAARGAPRRGWSPSFSGGRSPPSSRSTSRLSLRYATLIYGGLAAVAIFLFWLWLLALALLVGGEVNAQLDGIRDEMAANQASRIG